MGDEVVTINHFTVLVLCLVFVFIAGCTETPAQELTTREIAATFTEQQENVRDYSAIMDVYDGGTGNVDVICITAKYPDRYRVEHLASSKKGNGSYAVLNGTTLSEYSSRANLAYSEPARSPDGNFVAYLDFQRLVRDLIHDEENDVNSLCHDFIDERKTAVIEIRTSSSPLNRQFSEYRFSTIRVCIFTDTWMVATIKMYDESDTLIKRVNYREIQVNPGVPDDVFIFTPPEGAEIRPPFTPCITPLIFTSLHNAQWHLAPDIVLALPFYLPGGYVFSSSGADVGQDRHQMIWYQRGEITLRFDQGPVGTMVYGDFPDTEKQVVVNGVKGTFFSSGHENQLQWSAFNLSFALTGTPGEEEMVRIAESVAPAPYDPDTIPPYEYVPPTDPMVKTVAVHQTEKNRNVTVTFESIECTGERVEMVLCVELPHDPLATPTIPHPPGVTPPPRSPEPHGEFRVDDGRPLRALGFSYRPVGDSTLIFWRLEPIPSHAKVLHVNVSRFRENEGPWEFVIDLEG